MLDPRPDGTPAADFLRLAAHPLRWELLRELARSDRQVHELTALTGRPQNLVSYHLGQLRSAKLVSARRSSADARDAYYTADLDRLGALLAAAGQALHPGLRLAPVPDTPSPPTGAAEVRVLFLCTGNSSRSQIAEALARSRSGGRIEAHSAGSRPRPLHPCAVQVMAGRGIDLSGHRPKHLDEFAGQHFDYVITVCDKVREICPEFPGQPETVHWSIPDPAAAGDAAAAGCPAFERTAADLDTRIKFLVTALTGPAL
jgi:ArsR family transcriptional regulator, arsenate/arsenite/antimonite-responsive transcriptional repressor / arsenate reductase (thioredoxin)